jgi:hypothetical protein
MFASDPAEKWSDGHSGHEQSPPSPSKIDFRPARIAQLVEHFHGKEGVTSSSLVPGFSRGSCCGRAGLGSIARGDQLDGSQRHLGAVSELQRCTRASLALRDDKQQSLGVDIALAVGVADIS